MRKQATLADITTRCSNYAGPDHGDVSLPDWLIGPAGQHRDSDTIERSNFEVARDRLLAVDPDQHDHEVIRMRHWAVGWVEEIAYRPGSEVARVADSIRESLDGYAILDEHHHSKLESDEVNESWVSWQARDVRRDVTRELVSRIDPDDATCMSADEIEAWLDEVTDEQLWDIVHDRGDIYDGYLHLSAHDIEYAADMLVASQEVQPTE